MTIISKGIHLFRFSLFWALMIHARSHSMASSVKVILGHSHTVTSVGWSPDGRTIISGSFDETIKTWNASSGDLIKSFNSPSKNRIHSVSFSPDGQRFISASSDRNIYIWDSKSGDILTSIESSRSIRKINLSPHSVRSGLLWASDYPHSARFSPQGDRIAGGFADGNVSIFNTLDGRELVKLSVEKEDIESVSWSPDGERLVSACADGSVKIWSITDQGKLLLTLSGHTNAVASVAFSPDGKKIFSADYDGIVKIWNAENGMLDSSISAHDRPIVGLSVSSDGKMLATGSWDKKIKVWSLKTHYLMRDFSGHDGLVQSLSFSPDSKRLASGSSDASIRIWNTDLRRRKEMSPSKLQQKTLEKDPKSDFFQLLESPAVLKAEYDFELIGKLLSAINDIQELKLFYRLSKGAYKNRQISWEQHRNFVFRSFETGPSKISYDEKAYGVSLAKMMIAEAEKDGVLGREDRLRFDRLFERNDSQTTGDLGELILMVRKNENKIEQQEALLKRYEKDLVKSENKHFKSEERIKFLEQQLLELAKNFKDSCRLRARICFAASVVGFLNNGLDPLFGDAFAHGLDRHVTIGSLDDDLKYMSDTNFQTERGVFVCPSHSHIDKEINHTGQVDEIKLKGLLSWQAAIESDENRVLNNNQNQLKAVEDYFFSSK